VTNGAQSGLACSTTEGVEMTTHGVTMTAKSQTTRSFHLTPLAACLALALTGGALAQDNLKPGIHAQRHAAVSQAPRIRAMKGNAARHAPQPHGAQDLVTNCLDDGSAGSLRSVITAAADGDTVDLSTLTCSTITLTPASGQLSVPQNGLTLVGPTPTLAGPALTIDAGQMSRVLFASYDGGTLEIDNLAVANGNYQLDDTVGYLGGGGCIQANGGLTLVNSSVINCSATSGYVFGAAISTFGDLTVTNSVVSGNIATATSSAAGTETYIGVVGGAIYVYGNLVVTNSTVSGNQANLGTNGNNATVGFFGGGGIEIASYPGTQGNPQTSSITGSTISNNYSYELGGGVQANGNLTITNSTISGNVAANSAGGVNAFAASLIIENSTIAFNESYFTGGVYAPHTGGTLTLNSTIISNNSAMSTALAADLGAGDAITAAGANNLVMTSDAAVTFANPPLTADPQLQPLGNNGGPTQTLALISTSPAVDTGNNVAALPTDQRGPGYPRSINGKTDIGAFELGGDTIFANGFE
jgi:hypothetical protein